MRLIESKDKDILLQSFLENLKHILLFLFIHTYFHIMFGEAFLEPLTPPVGATYKRGYCKEYTQRIKYHAKLLVTVFFDDLCYVAVYKGISPSLAALWDIGPHDDLKVRI
ncbi:hypothetical protein ACJX0J_013198, partial [Zea mays]